MNPLETNRLLLRNFQTSDWEALHEMIVEYERSELAVYDQPWPTAAEEIKTITDWFASGDQFIAVCLKESGSFIGFVALNPEQASHQTIFNIGFIFAQDYRGKGFAFEACQAGLERAFQELQAEIVVSGTAAANAAACTLLAKLGFQKTGENTASFQKSAEGKPIEFLAYTFELSRREWKAAKKSNL
jgi:RimJ/RimL family protein N-acetyltransferase